MSYAMLDRSIQTLAEHKDAWATLAIPEKMALLLQVRANLRTAGARWVEASVEAKQLDPDSPWVGEEWATGPWAVAANINGLLDTLHALSQGHAPRLKKVTTRSNGQIVVQVFPSNVFETLLLNGITGEVWMPPGVTRDQANDHLAVFYKQKNPKGRVVLVLGAGNINSIAPLDILYKLYAEGQVVILKMNPINEYLGPILEEVFAPFIEPGYLRITYGDGVVGSYLVHHEQIDEVHITGSARTHDLIVFGAGAEGAERKKRNEPLMDKPMTSELGGVGPAIIVPGEWSKAELRYQAERVATMKLHNGGFNCVASQVLILAESWPQREAFLQELRLVIRELPERTPFYPGAQERQRQVMAMYPGAEEFDSERTLITELDPTAQNERLFREELFCGVYAQTSLPGQTAAEFLGNAVAFCNSALDGTLGATIIVHPRTMKELGSHLDEAIENMRYGAIGVNVWNGVAFLLASCPWGAHPGHTAADIQSGIGVVHNTKLIDQPQKTVVRGSFYAFPRGWAHGDFHIAPKPPWFVTNRTAAVTGRRIARFAADPGFKHLPGIFVSALRG